MSSRRERCTDGPEASGNSLAQAMKNRRKYVKDAGIVDVLPSGEVRINWQKAAKSRLLRDEIEAMRRIEKQCTGIRGESDE